MGSSGRDYFRDDDPYGSSWDPTGGERPPLSLPTKVAIVFGLLFFLTSVVPSLLPHIGLSRDGLLSGQLWQLLSYAFVADREGVISVIFSCLIIYSFGTMLIQSIGEREFLYFLVATALFGGVAQVITSAYSTAGTLHLTEAVLLWLALRRPHEKISLFGLIEIPLWGCATAFIGLAAYGSLQAQFAYASNPELGRTAYLMAFPSFAGCLLFAFLHERFRWRIADLVGVGLSDRISSRLKSRQLSSRRKQSSLRVFEPEDAEEKQPSAKEVASAAEVDRILEKIHQEGEASLTSKERKLLAKESKRLRGRRG